MLEPSTSGPVSSPGYRSARDGDRAFIYRLVEMTERSLVERLRRWDEAVERVRVDALLGRGKVDILTRGVVPVGVLAVERGEDRLRLNLLRVLPIWQRRGYGRLALRAVLDDADRARLPVSITLYKIDAAAEFYRRLGFAVEEESMLTRTMVRSPRG